MRLARSLCLLLAVALPAVSLAGDIQVTCEPGLHVFLDGKLMGTSSEKEDGFFLANVPEGKHVVRVDKPGYLPQGFEVQVPKLPIQVKVGKFIPVLKGMLLPKETTYPEQGALVGELTITSAPQNCTVTIDGKSEEKTIPYLTVGSLAAGKHTISFSREGYEPISEDIDMEEGSEITVRGDLLNGKVEVTYEGKGSLRVISSPQSCTIQFLGTIRDKTSPILNISYVPAGKHHMVVSWGGRKLSTDIVIANHRRTIVEVNFGDTAEPFKISYEPE